MVARLASHEIFAESMMIQPHLAEAMDQKRVVYRDPIMEISIGLKMEGDLVIATPSALLTSKRSGPIK